MNAIYHLLAIVVAVLGLIRGYRSGLTGQATAVIGMAFGIVCAHLFSPPVEDWLWSILPGIGYSFAGDLFLGMLAAAIPFTLVFLLMMCLHSIFRSAMQVFDTGILDQIFGAAFCSVKYLFFLSILLNLMVDLNPRSEVVKFATDHDANMVELVMKLAPYPLGAPDVEELAHRVQLEDAKKIS